MKRIVPLEPAAQHVCDTSAKPPLIFQLPPEQGRQVLEKAQDTPVYKYPAEIASVQVDTGEWGSIPVYFVRPERFAGIPNVIFYIHGAGWVFGSFHTHEKLVRELAARTNSVVVFPEYSRSPEVRYPVAVEQCYHLLCRLPELLKNVRCEARLDTLTVAGDSVGGNMATVLACMAQQKNGPKLHKQLLYYPVTNADFNTPSYRMFAVDYYLYRAGMMWFWNQYAPDSRQRRQIMASPLLAPLNQLQEMPPTMIINGEADVLRDEGEAYARKLRLAGVDVTSIRFGGIIHDFVMLNALDQTNACRAAMDVSTDWINRKNRC